MPADGSSYGHIARLTGLLIGYARVSTDKQDLTAQRVPHHERGHAVGQARGSGSSWFVCHDGERSEKSA